MLEIFKSCSPTMYMYMVFNILSKLTNLCGNIISQCTKDLYSIQKFEYTSSMYGWYSKAVHKICIACLNFWKHRLWVRMGNIQNLSLPWNHIMILYTSFQILNTLWTNMGDFQKCWQIMIITYCSKIWKELKTLEYICCWCPNLFTKWAYANHATF